MVIYVVQNGDTINSIAHKNDVTVERLIQDNGITSTMNLVPGQAIVITFPEQTHIVQEGDTLASIADEYGISIMQLYQYNAFLSDRMFLNPGETLVISYSTEGDLVTHGYLYSHINRGTLLKTLPLLSYISVFNYRITEEFEIIAYGEDTDIIQLAIDYGTIPIMMISSISLEGIPNIELIYEILLNKELQDQLIKDSIDIVKMKGYYGINILVSGLNTTNQQLYIDFIRNFSTYLRNEGLYFFISINLNVQDTSINTSRDKLDYTTISNYVDGFVFLQYYWGTNPGAPKPVNYISHIRNYIEYVVTLIPKDKISIGLTLIGYDWELPYRPNISKVTSMSPDAVIVLAHNVNATIQFDVNSYTPYYDYQVLNPWASIDHIVWFIDARSINSLLELNYEEDILGSGIWGIMTFNQQLWALIYSRFRIIKFLPVN